MVRLQVLVVIYSLNSSIMEWIVKTQSPVQVFALRAEGQELLSYTVNAQTSSLRANSLVGQRNFYFDKAGFWRNKVVMENEYGMPVGKIHYRSLHHPEGTIEIDGLRCHFRYYQDTVQHIDFYTSNASAPQMVCEIPSGVNSRFPAGDALHYMLTATCWYLQKTGVLQARSTVS
jgi:hypothetical protein